MYYATEFSSTESWEFMGVGGAGIGGWNRSRAQETLPWTAARDFAHTWPWIRGNELGKTGSGGAAQLDDGEMFPTFNEAHRQPDPVTALTAPAITMRPTGSRLNSSSLRRSAITRDT